jgi:hypothetical protein
MDMTTGFRLRTMQQENTRHTTENRQMSYGFLQRTCACGGTPGLDGTCTECRGKRLGVWPKLVIGGPHDRYEQEADRVADAVMHTVGPRAVESIRGAGKTGRARATAITPWLQRQAIDKEPVEEEGVEAAEAGPEEGETEELSLQRSPQTQGATSAVPSIVHETLNDTGQPLDQPTCAFMESRFGHDFSQVRVHTNAKAAESACTVNALAYTVGRDVVFGGGQYAPTTSAGQRLLAHELAHVVQQGAQYSILARKVVDPSMDARLRQVLLEQRYISSDLPSSAGSYYFLAAPPRATDPSVSLRDGESLIDAILSTVSALRPTLDSDPPPSPMYPKPVTRELKLALSDVPESPATAILEATAHGYRLNIEVLVPQLLPEGMLGRPAIKQAIAEGRLSNVQLVSHTEVKHTEVEPPALNPAMPCTPVPPDQIVWKRTSAGKLHIDAGGEGKHPEANNLNWSSSVHGGGAGPALKDGDPIPNLVCGNILSTWPIGDRQADIITVEGSPMNPIEIARVIKDGGKIAIIEGGLREHLPKLLDELGPRVNREAALVRENPDGTEFTEFEVKP